MPKFLEVTDKSAARSALEFDQTVSSLRTHVDLRDWDAVRAAQWKVAPGGQQMTSGSATVTATPFTAADVGKTVLFMYDLISGDTYPQYKWWMTTVASVGLGGLAQMSTTAPATATTNVCRYGFDGTTAINAALQEINASSVNPAGWSNPDQPCEVYLGGHFRMSQLVVPPYVVLRGVHWTDRPSGNAWHGGRNSMTVLAQLPGSNKDFVIFGPNAQSDAPGTNFTGPSGFTDFKLLGPEVAVTGIANATVGNGLAFRTPLGNTIWVIDGFELSHVHSSFFPENGFLFPIGAVPGHFDRLLAVGNGKYGLDYLEGNTSGTQALHLSNFSGDGNNLGAVRLRNLSRHSAFVITNLKSEATPGPTGTGMLGPNNGYYMGPGYQKDCIILEECDESPVVVNGVSHIVGGAYVGPGPAITIKSATTKRPNLTFSGIGVRVLGTGYGDADPATTVDAVTVRDLVADVDIPRTVKSGQWPRQMVSSLTDRNGNPVAEVIPATNATNYIEIYNNVAGAPPVISPRDPASQNCSIAITPRGNGAIQVGGSQPRLVALSNLNLNLQTTGSGVVQANGNEVETVNRKGAANGYAPLDSGGKLSASFLPSSAMQWQGVWAADTNTPTLADGTGDAGDVYRVSVGGTRNLGSGSVTYSVGDLVIYDGSVWQRSDSTDAVTTVNGYSGTVTLTKSDVGLGNAENTADAVKSVASAATLTTGRTFRTDLASTSTVTFNGAGDVTPGVTGTLAVGNGGTGASTLTGIVRGNGTGAFTAAVAGTDFLAPGGSGFTIPPRTSTATASGTTTLTASSNPVQVFTGSAGQTVVLPTTSVTAGQRFLVINNSSAASLLTVNASNGSAVISLYGTGFTGLGSASAYFVANVDTPTTPAHWHVIPFAVSDSGSFGGVYAPNSAVMRNANSNIGAVNFIPRTASTATAAATTTLNIGSGQAQIFTGTTTQTVTLPTTSVTAGMEWKIINRSTGNLTINSSAGNLVATMTGGTEDVKVCIALRDTPTAATHWRAI